MNPESENFDQLRRLLTLKRHEQPPPGYFIRFSNQVVARIEAGEKGEAQGNLWSFFAQPGWLQRFWATLDARPALAGAVGLGICGVFAVGLILSDKSDTTLSPALGGPQALISVSTPQPNALPFDNPMLATGSLANENPSLMGMPTIQPAGSIFDRIPTPGVSQAVYPIGNN